MEKARGLLDSLIYLYVAYGPKSHTVFEGPQQFIMTVCHNISHKSQ